MLTRATLLLTSRFSERSQQKKFIGYRELLASIGSQTDLMTTGITVKIHQIIN